MQVKFQGQYTIEEAAESLLSIVKMFEDRYGVQDFSSLQLDVTLLNNEGEEVEIIDANTSEVLDVFEVHRSPTAVNHCDDGTLH